jgi:carbonic anhydrase
MTFPWIQEAVDEGRLTVSGYRFDIHTGVLLQVEADGERPVE